MILQCENKIITLRDPQKGETYTPDLNIKVKVSMNGQRWGYALPSDFVNIQWEFRNISRQKINELFDFINYVRSKEVQVKLLKRPKTTQEKYEVWKGKILTNPTTSTAEQSFDNTFNLSFNGKLVGEAGA